MRRLAWFGVSAAVLCLVWSVSTDVLMAQGAKPAPKPAPPRQAAPARPRPASAAPAPQARAVKRTDVVNPQTISAFEKEGDRVAVVVAIGHYGDDLAPLQWTMADAVELSAELRRQGYAVFTLLNRAATADNIRQRLAELATNKPGTLLFAFAGHGFQSSAGANYLATYGTSVDALEQQGLAVAEVEGLMRKSGAKQNVLLIDACRNVPGTRAVTSTTSFRDFTQSEGVRMLLSTRPGGFSYEDPTLEHGIFSHFVIEGLRGKAANTDGKITFDDLANYVEKNVFSYASSRNFVQKPFRGGEASGDFLLATGTPLKEEEVVREREASGSKNLTNDATLLSRQGALDTFMVIRRDTELRIYQAPMMASYAVLKLNADAKGLPEGHERYEGSAGKGDLLMHAVVRLQGNEVVELKGRVGVECKANCTGQDLRLPGESAAVASTAGRVAQVAGGIGKLIGGRRGDRVTNAAAGADQGLAALASRSWTGFNLQDERR